MLEERRENMLHLDDYLKIAKEVREWEKEFRKGMISKEEYDELVSHKYDSEKDIEEPAR